MSLKEADLLAMVAFDRGAAKRAIRTTCPTANSRDQRTCSKRSNVISHINLVAGRPGCRQSSCTLWRQSPVCLVSYLSPVGRCLTRKLNRFAFNHSRCRAQASDSAPSPTRHGKHSERRRPTLAQVRTKHSVSRENISLSSLFRRPTNSWRDFGWSNAATGIETNWQLDKFVASRRSSNLI